MAVTCFIFKVKGKTVNQPRNISTSQLESTPGAAGDVMEAAGTPLYEAPAREKPPEVGGEELRHEVA